MKAVAKNIRISPKKMNVAAAIVRNMDAKHALDTLKYMPTKGGQILYKVVASAVANAIHNGDQELANLVVSSVVIGQGIVYKRGNPISRGRSHPILKRTSNISLELQAR